MAAASILYEARHGVAHITLNRPDVLNSFDSAMSLSLQQILAEVTRDVTLRAVYLTGAGRAFCAGQDLSEATSPGAAGIVDFGTRVRNLYNPLVLALRRMPKPVVCAVNGVAAGAGANLALACDIVLAAEEAAFLQAFIKIGLVPDTGGTWSLPRLVGSAQAAALMLLGEKLPAARALELGLIYKVCPGAELETTAFGLAVQLATQPTYALSLIKQLLAVSSHNSLEQQLELEAESQGLAGKSDDYAEGVRAFLEKRKPTFVGK
ncbi:MAG TPA: enoyl-CoA hydratase-related protein [Gemmatimonadales bacterium]|jgi:2-(1,2-epoxy-1,2-dihydrophenyl)acetyl-CoA isomerase|nr:enoyl-CoA hydratase-related protein [Gemmatimonadales bacterium]